jgi:hypothetical protein
MTTALYSGVPLPAVEKRCQAVCDPRRCHRHEKPGRCHHFPAYAPGIGNLTGITTETPGTMMKRSTENTTLFLDISGVLPLNEEVLC